MKYADFDPFLFLEITNLTTEEKNRLKPKLLSKIAEFFLLKIVQEKPNAVLPAASLEEIFSFVSKDRVALYLEEFKTKFQKT